MCINMSNNYGGVMKKLIYLIGLMFSTLLLGGCGRKIANDSEYNFINYFAITDEPDTKNLPDCSLSLATDQNGNIYLKEITRDKKDNEDLKCTLLIENGGQVIETNMKETFSKGYGMTYIVTADKKLYINNSNRHSKYQYMIDDFERLDFTTSLDVLALNSHGQLYSWGENRGGGCGVGQLAYQTTDVISNPQLILENVRDFGGGQYFEAYAITDDNDLYVWGFARRISSGDFSKSVNYEILTPTYRASNVEFVEPHDEYLMVHFLDGTSLELTENGNAHGLFAETFNTEGNASKKTPKNSFDERFSSIIKVLDAHYDNGKIESIYGTVENPTDKELMRIEIQIELFDNYGEHIDSVVAIVTNLASAQRATFSLNSSDISYLEARTYEVSDIRTY